MRKHLSVLMLAARSTVYKVVGLLLIMAAVQAALFRFALQNDESSGLELLITQSRVPLVCGVCFLILCALLSLTGCELHGSKLRYTLQRLSVDERTTVLWWAAYNIICLIIFWGVQLAVVLLLCRIYTAQADPARVSGQTVFLAFYRNKFLHSLLPLGETSRYIRNVLLIVGLGVSSACFSFRLRHGEKGIAVIVLAAAAVVFFPQTMGSFGNDLFMYVLTLAVTASAVSGLWNGRDNEA